MKLNYMIISILLIKLGLNRLYIYLFIVTKQFELNLIINSILKVF